MFVLFRPACARKRSEHLKKVKNGDDDSEHDDDDGDDYISGDCLHLLHIY